MVEGLTLARLHERLAALKEWRRLGGSAEALAELDRRVRHGRRSDYPGRGSGAEARTPGEPAGQRRQPESGEGKR